MSLSPLARHVWYLSLSLSLCLSLYQECQELREAGHTQAMGAATMLAESRAREEETIARLQLVEVQTSQEVALANKEVTDALFPRPPRVCTTPAYGCSLQPLYTACNL